MSYNNYDMLKTYEDLRSVLSNLGNNIYKVDKKNIQNSKNKLELILNNLAFYLSEINGIPLHQENVKFISSDDMKKKCNNGFACADPVDKSIYFSIDNIFNAINQIKESKKYTYSSTGMAIFMIDCITHELKHRDQFLYTDETKKISKEKIESKPQQATSSSKKKRKNRNKKKKKSNKKSGDQNKNKSMFMGLNGVQYDEEGNEKENIDDSEDNNNGEFTSPFLNDYLSHIKASNKTSKAKKYLEDFKNKKWKFNKNMQIHLLKYILYENIFDKEYFDIFKEYMINMYKDTKTNFLKKCQEYIDTIKNCNEDEANLNFKLDSHELKFQNIENKKLILYNLNKRCIDIIENN